MQLPVWVEQQNGRFTATVLGAPQLRADGATKEEAVTALRAALTVRVVAGELVFVDAEPKGLVTLAGRYADDEEAREMWDEIVTEIYRQRDEQKAQEFPE
jgi:uncharacterized NAD(P)/FAD-binding protein YdhS